MAFGLDKCAVLVQKRGVTFRCEGWNCAGCSGDG